MQLSPRPYARALAREHEQRRMLRMILGLGRKHTIVEICTDNLDVDSDVDVAYYAIPEMKQSEVLETWTDWIKRVTHKVEDQLQNRKIESLIQQARVRKQNFAERALDHTAD